MRDAGEEANDISQARRTREPAVPGDDGGGWIRSLLGGAYTQPAQGGTFAATALQSPEMMGQFAQGQALGNVPQAQPLFSPQEMARLSGYGGPGGYGQFGMGPQTPMQQAFLSSMNQDYANHQAGMRYAAGEHARQQAYANEMDRRKLALSEDIQRGTLAHAWADLANKYDPNRASNEMFNHLVASGHPEMIPELMKFAPKGGAGGLRLPPQGTSGVPDFMYQQQGTSGPAAPASNIEVMLQQQQQQKALEPVLMGIAGQKSPEAMIEYLTPSWDAIASNPLMMERAMAGMEMSPAFGGRQQLVDKLQDELYKRLNTTDSSAGGYRAAKEEGIFGRPQLVSPEGLIKQYGVGQIPRYGTIDELTPTFEETKKRRIAQANAVAAMLNAARKRPGAVWQQ